ncbi:MAG: ATP-binding protein [Anaerolineae bacterium]|nr:ATP-binding protein [Anaerolineae bacterium]
MGESLKALRDYAVEAAQQAELPKARVEGLRLAVDEYATNIITYGYRDAGYAGDVEAAAQIDDDHLIISLIDAGLAYDPTNRPDPTDLDTPLEERDIGGLGIMLVRQSVDEWRYERRDNRNYNHFVLKRNKSEGSS